MPGMHDIVMLHQHGRIKFRYDQIDKICQAAKAGSIDVIKLTGWSEGGHDNQYPDFLPSERLGGEEALRIHLRQARKLGYRIVLYMHFVQMSPNSEFYRKHGEFCAIKGPYGNPFIDIFTWPSHGSIIAINERFQLINACVETEVWQQQVLDCVRRALTWGVDCVMLDQTAGSPSSFLCFDARHGHPNPAYSCGPGKTRLSQRARDLVRADGNQTALAAEYVCDVILQYYDFTIPFGSGSFYGGQHFGEMYRFTFPEDVLTTQYIARENYSQMHYSFVMGYRFFLTPGQQCDILTDMDEHFVKRLSNLMALRRKHAAILLRGRFLETEPLQIANDTLVARAYQSEAGYAVAVWNPSPRLAPLSVSWPGQTLVSAETPAGPIALDDLLGVDDVAVLLFK